MRSARNAGLEIFRGVSCPHEDLIRGSEGLCCKAVRSALIALLVRWKIKFELLIEVFKVDWASLFEPSTL